MAQSIDRIAGVEIRLPSSVLVAMTDGTRHCVDLAGWIATGGDILAPLRSAQIFGRAAVSDHGAAIAWDDGDLAIDARHLVLLAGEQQAFDGAAIAAWQAAMALSNHEAADFLGIAVSTWHGYKTGSTIPVAVAMACRAARRDPLIMQAHLRPRRPAGRPRATA